MKKLQVFVVDEPKTHTSKPVWLCDIKFSDKTELTLGQIIVTLEERVTALEAENKKLKQAINDTIGVAALLNSK